MRFEQCSDFYLLVLGTKKRMSRRPAFKAFLLKVFLYDYASKGLVPGAEGPGSWARFVRRSTLLSGIKTSFHLEQLGSIESYK